MNLDLPKKNNSFCKLINDLIVKLSKKFEITKSSDLEKAVELSTYLLAIKKNQESENLLKSFTFEIKDDARSYALGHKKDGLSILAFMYYINNDFDRFKKIVADITSINFDKDDFDWLIEQAEDDLKYYISDRVVFKEIEGQLTEKEITLGYYSKIVKFSYYYVVLFFLAEKQCQYLLKEILLFLNEEIRFLRERLNGSSGRTYI